MATVSRDKLKKRGFKRLKNSFKNSANGLIYAYKNEQSLTIHSIMLVLVIIIGLIVELSLAEWLIAFVLIGLIMVIELVNTSIEAVVDLVTDEYHHLAKIAKDTASAAVFIASALTGVTLLIIFIAKIVR